MGRYVDSGGRPEMRTGSVVVVRSQPWDRAGRVSEQLTRQAKDDRRSASFERYASALTERALRRCETEAHRIERRGDRERQRNAARVARLRQRDYDRAAARVAREDKAAEQRKACGNMAWLASE